MAEKENITMSSKSSSSSSCCLVCGKHDSKDCARCKNASYCSKECQKKDWKRHKKECFPPDSTCTRCLLKISITDSGGNNVKKNPQPCRVAHPEHLLQDMGSMFGSGGTTLQFHCKGCNTSFSKSAPGINAGAHSNWTYEPASARWCYCGPHTTKALCPKDQRRVDKSIVSLEAHCDIQDDIEELDATQVRILTIKSAGCYDDEITPVLNQTWPNLEELHLIDVAFEEITLIETMAPKLRVLEMQNIPDDCAMEISCPTLEEVDIRYHHGEEADEWVNNMLKHAKQLKKFSSYKLGVDSICFQSNVLKEVHLHRSDCLGHVLIWAPRLEYLRLQGCYSLDRLDILEQAPPRPNHNNSNNPPAAQSFSSTTRTGGSQFVVETINSCLSPQVEHVLASHPRIEWSGDEEDESAGVGGVGMEALFNQMHQQQQFGGF